MPKIGEVLNPFFTLAAIHAPFSPFLELAPAMAHTTKASMSVHITQNAGQVSKGVLKFKLLGRC